MHDPAPDLNLQLIILAGMFVLALAGALVIELRMEKKRDAREKLYDDEASNHPN